MISESLLALASAGGVSQLTGLEGAELHAAVGEVRALIDSAPIAPGDASALFAGSTFHGPTAIQAGDHSHRNDHFGHSG